MNIPQDTFAQWHLLVQRLKQTLFVALRTPDNRVLLEEAVQLSANLEGRLEQAGELSTAVAEAESFELPLELLDTPLNRRCLSALEDAYQAMLAVDRERYGDDIGSDGEAQVLAVLVAEKRLEIFGPAGAGE